ncbi:MAG: phage tail assembly protein [Bacteroidota bacterium]
MTDETAPPPGGYVRTAQDVEALARATSAQSFAPKTRTGRPVPQRAPGVDAPLKSHAQRRAEAQPTLREAMARPRDDFADEEAGDDMGVSPAAMAAASGAALLREKLYTLEVPVIDGAGREHTQLVLRRPKWCKVEECLAHDLVTSKKLSANSAMIAACAGVPLDFMLELDFVDGLALVAELADFFPQALRDRLQPGSA